MAKKANKFKSKQITKNKVAKAPSATFVAPEEDATNLEIMAASNTHKLSTLVKALSLVALFVVTTAAIIYSWPIAAVDNAPKQLAVVHQHYDAMIVQIEALQVKQQQLKRNVINDPALTDALTKIQGDTSAGNFSRAEAKMKNLKAQLKKWREELAKPLPTPIPVVQAPVGPNHSFAPILLYHHPPADMDAQFAYLVHHGYVSVSLQQVANAQNGGEGLPVKPIVITFDDGFGDQMPVLELLKKYNLRAVFYIINGGEGSNFHIGANKKANDPEGGDAYLSWDQIRTLDQSGYAEIASHTTDHLDLARQTPEIQRNEIVDGKHYLENQLGHAVTDFCYPYGAFTQTTINIVREAGFATATTTLPGTDQSLATAYTLRRIRNAFILP